MKNKIASGQPIEVEIEPPIYSGKFERFLPGDIKKAIVKANHAKAPPAKYITKNVVAVIILYIQPV
jgi:hypothetical protein